MPAESFHEAIWRDAGAGEAGPGLELRLRFALAHARSGARLLDVGCGDGRIAEHLAAAGASVVCADVAAAALERARERSPALELVKLEPAAAWPFADSSFDVVWAGEVIEHVADTAAWLSEARRVLRSGGTLALSTPDTGPLTLAAMALSPAYAARRLDPRSDHLHLYTRRSLAALLRDFRFAKIRIRGAGGLPGARATLLASAVRERF